VPLADRVRALLEVLVCSGYPTQIFVLGVLTAAGLGPRDDAGRLSLAFVAALSLLDAVLLIAIIIALLKAGGERPRDVFLGSRPIGRDAAFGVLLVPVSFLVAVTVLALARLLMPALHNVPVNPLEDILQTPRDRSIAAVVVTVAGGLREEMQRAFVLHRFDRYLGGGLVGLAVFSIAFGLGHVEQGRDVALATTALGAFWGAIYLRRRSIVSPGVAHAGFNLSEIVRHAFVVSR
jgi:membrane protease YdiL (CAAX protease family)